MTTMPRPAALALLAGALVLAACSSDATDPTATPATATADAKGGPKAPPSNGRIYYTMPIGFLEEIFSILPDGSDRRRLTYSTLVEHRDLAVSRDGKKLAFVATQFDEQMQPVETDIWTMNSDGSNRRRVTTLGQNVGTPRFSPDGRTILFAYAEPGAFSSGLWSVSVSGGGLRKVRDDSVEPTWSPDGARIAFISVATGTYGDLMTADADGANASTLADCGAGLCGAPAWSPDGKRVLFWYNGQNLNGVCEFVGSYTSCTNYGAWLGNGATFSPDGSYVVGVVSEHLAVTSFGSTAVTAITDAQSFYTRPVWGR
jgi:Tol biopolymer transport system component